MKNRSDLTTLLTRTMDRRRLLGNLGLMGAGAALTACSSVIAQPNEDPDVDVAILNFALNLEYLEAEFYLAAVGRTASYESEVTGTVMANGPVDFTGTPDLEDLANEIADDEEAHVVFLRSALGSAAVDRPNLDLRGGVGGAFGTAARAAGATAGLDVATLDVLETFSPYTNGLFFLHGAFIFEDVGVTAYKGAAPLITDKGTLEAAAGILAVEAYHAGEVRTQLYQERNTVAIPADAGGAGNVELTVQSIVGAISALRAALGGGKDQSIVVDGRANIVVADTNAIAYSRTPAEVLSIVFAGGVSGGLFFPNGVNGDFSALL